MRKHLLIKVLGRGGESAYKCAEGGGGRGERDRMAKE
jgi:hypothetical protein